MCLVPKVHCKIIRGLSRAGRVQLARTVCAAYPGQKHPFDVGWGRCARWDLKWRCYYDLSISMDGTMSHGPLKGIVLPVLAESVERGIQPVRRRRLPRLWSAGTSKLRPGRVDLQQRGRALPEPAVEEPVRAQAVAVAVAEWRWMRGLASW